LSKLIIVTNVAAIDNAGRNAVTAYLEGRGWSVWHWFQDLWLIDSNDVVDPVTLREELNKVLPSLAQVIVFSTRDAAKHYSGLVPPDSVDWFTQHWG
jgi:hypothetical protein